MLDAYPPSSRRALQGRTDFTIDIELGSSYFDSAGQSDKLQVFQTTLNMRYYY